MPTWSLYEGAALSCGQDPSTYEGCVDVHEPNPISKRVYWLNNKSFKGQLGPNVGEGNSVFKIRHNTGSILRALEEKFSCDKDLRKALDHMYMAPYGIDHSKFVSRSVYRQAGRMIFKDYPKATKKQVADILVNLPNYYNNDDYGHISTLQAHQIEAFLKGLNDLKQKPAKNDLPAICCDLAQLVENM